MRGWPGGARSLAILLAFSGCSDNPSDKKATPPPVPVTTAVAEARDIPVSLDLVGRAEAYESVSLKSRVDGQVASVLFVEGQHVKGGEALVQLDPADFRARLQQAEASVARSEAQLAKARADTERYLSLRSRNFISDEKLNDIRTNEAAITANLHADRAALELARSQLSYATIRAPFAGIVGARLVFPGSAVKINDTALAVVNRVKPLLVGFALPERQLARLKRAMADAGGRLKATIGIPGDSEARLEGEVHFLDNAVDTATGTVQMKALLPNADERLTPGQFLKVGLRLDTLKQAVTVPNEAVQQGAEGNFVFVVKTDDTVDLRKVAVAATHGGQSAIGKGLEVGETVVTDGQLRLTPGARIKGRDAPGKTEPATAVQR